MDEIRGYFGIIYSIPRTDDGIWHYKIHPPRLSANSARPEPAPVSGYASRAAAIKAAERAIDDWIRQRSRA
jgi:hypothetical protein